MQIRVDYELSIKHAAAAQSAARLEQVRLRLSPKRGPRP
jgi:hypothetical protein